MEESVQRDFLSQRQSQSPCQLLHYPGDEATADRLRSLYHSKGISATVKAFESRMELAWSAADLALARSGASTIAEMLEFAVPALLVPYPYAMDNHQEKNADSIINRTGGAVKLLEQGLTAQTLVTALNNLLANDLRGVHALRERLETAGRESAKFTLCDLVIETLNRR